MVTHHDRINNIIVIVFECFDCLFPCDIWLLHDEFYIFFFDTSGINLKQNRKKRFFKKIKRQYSKLISAALP